MVVLQSSFIPLSPLNIQVDLPNLEPLPNLKSKSDYKILYRCGVTSGPPVQNFRRPPSRSAKGTSRAPYMHEFSRGSRACSFGKFLNLDSLKCHFLDFGERFYRILTVRKRHCNISEALANVFSLSPKLGAPFGPLGLGALGLSRSEPIVVTPLILYQIRHSSRSFYK